MYPYWTPFPILLAVCILGQTTDPTLPIETVDEVVSYECGQGLEAQTYATEDLLTLCLFFDNMTPPQKVVYSVKVDSFESLQVSGLYSLFKDEQ